jgi:hypothetical protein
MCACLRHQSIWLAGCWAATNHSSSADASFFWLRQASSMRGPPHPRAQHFWACVRLRQGRQRPTRFKFNWKPRHASDSWVDLESYNKVGSSRIVLSCTEWKQSLGLGQSASAALQTERSKNRLDLCWQQYGCRHRQACVHMGRASSTNRLATLWHLVGFLRQQLRNCFGQDNHPLTEREREGK